MTIPFHCTNCGGHTTNTGGGCATCGSAISFPTFTPREATESILKDVTFAQITTGVDNAVYDRIRAHIRLLSAAALRAAPTSGWVDDVMQLPVFDVKVSGPALSDSWTTILCVERSKVLGLLRRVPPTSDPNESPTRHHPAVDSADDAWGHDEPWSKNATPPSPPRREAGDEETVVCLRRFDRELGQMVFEPLPSPAPVREPSDSVLVEEFKAFVDSAVTMNRPLLNRVLNALEFAARRATREGANG